MGRSGHTGLILTYYQLDGSEWCVYFFWLGHFVLGFAADYLHFLLFPCFETKVLGAAKRELDCEESWALKNWCFWTVVLEKTLESPLDCKEIQLVHSKGDQSWVFIGRTDVRAETPILWPPHAKSWLIGKDSDAGRDWEQEEKGTTEDEMAGWHHRLDGHGFGWTPGVGDGQGGLACCSSRGRKSQTRLSDWTELNWKLEFPQLDCLLISLFVWFL